MKRSILACLGLLGLVLVSGCAATSRHILPAGESVQTQIELSNESGQYLWIAKVNSKLDVINPNQWIGLEKYGLHKFPLYSNKENLFAVEFYNTKAQRAGFSKNDVRIRSRIYLSFAGTNEDQYAEILETQLYAKEMQVCIVYNDANWPALFRSGQGHNEIRLAPGEWKSFDAPGNEWLKYSWVWLDQNESQFKEYAGRRWQDEGFVDNNQTDHVWQIDDVAVRVGVVIRLYWDYGNYR